MSDAADKTSKRLAAFEKMTKAGTDDPMAWYGLGMEYRRLERNDDALRTFTELRRRLPDYVPTYLMCAQLLVDMGRRAEAREWSEKGIVVAAEKKDSHAKGELESFLAGLD